MKLNPLHIRHDLSSNMTEGELRCLVYDLQSTRHIDEAEARALCHLIEDLHADAHRARQKLAEAGVS